MSNGYHRDDESELPVLEEVIRPAPESATDATDVAGEPEPALQTQVSAIIERHAREAIEEINALLSPREDDSS